MRRHALRHHSAVVPICTFLALTLLDADCVGRPCWLSATYLGRPSPIWLYSNIWQQYNYPLVCCRLCCKAMLCDWDPLGKGTVTYPLVAAVLKRLAQDPEHLKLPYQLPAQHQGSACPGCNKCSGPDWQWKTETVASMLPYFCESCLVAKHHMLC